MGTAGSGRRPGESGTRAAILAAAGRHFAEYGYDRTSLRAVAKEAKVDPALVLHFFGSKAGLFAAVVELPFDPETVLPTLLAGDRQLLGARLARFVVDLLDREESRHRIVGLIRSATSEPEAARVVRDLVTRELLTPLIERLDVPDAEFRAALIGAQFVGLAMARSIVGVEPLASRSSEAVATAIAPLFQRILFGPLDSECL